MFNVVESVPAFHCFLLLEAPSDAQSSGVFSLWILLQNGSGHRHEVATSVLRQADGCLWRCDRVSTICRERAPDVLLSDFLCKCGGGLSTLCQSAIGQWVALEGIRESRFRVRMHIMRTLNGPTLVLRPHSPRTQCTHDLQSALLTCQPVSGPTWSLSLERLHWAT